MGRKVIERIIFPSERGMVREAIAFNREQGDDAMADMLEEHLKTMSPKNDRAEEHEVTVSDGQPSGTRRINPATEKQTWLIEKLLQDLGRGNDDQRKVFDEALAWYATKKPTLTFELASKTITRLKQHLGLPVNPNFLNNKDGAMTAPTRTPQVQVFEPETPAEAPKKREFKPLTLDDGYYAIVIEGKTHFYRMSTNKTTNRRKMQEQASDALHYVRWPNALHIQDLILAVGVDKAQKLYADELGQCYRCGKTLTDDESRALGIGPTCRKKI